MSRLVILGTAALAACSIPDTAFHATPDGGIDNTSHVLAIVASAHTLDVDEGKTVDFTIALSQAPSAEVLVKVLPADPAAAASIALSVPELRFQPSNFDQPQAVTVTGLPDADAADAHASIALTADTLDAVSVGVTVHDHDVVEIATDIASSAILTVNETGSSVVHVHLTHRPPGDVRIKPMLGLGPVTVTPAERTFTTANYDTDQTFTFSAPNDVNIVSEDESLTFQGTGLPDKLYTIHDVDNDTLNINATPTTMSVNEGGTASLNVSLTAQPAVGDSIVVHVAVQNGNVTIDKANLSFDSTNFDRVQVVTVGAPPDQNTTNESDQITLSVTTGPTVSPVTIGVTTIDDDVQAILEDAPNPLSATENQTTSFGVTLKFQPTSNVTVVVSSLDGNVATASPGTLTFTPANFADPTMHQVTVRGAHDSNLVTNMTSIKLHEPTLVDVLVPVSVADIDRQAIVVSSNALTIPEGTSGAFDVSLMFDPGTTTTVNIASDKPAVQVPASSAAFTFTGGPSGSWATPVRVTLNAPLDTNNVSEVATVTASGGGAAAPSTVQVTVMDGTVVASYGFPAPPAFTSSASFSAGSVLAYRVPVAASANLDSFGVAIPAGVGDFRMALYADAGSAPGALVAEMPVRQAISNAAGGINLADISPDVAISVGTYWIAIRFAQTTVVSQSPTVLDSQCFRNLTIPSLDSPWPTAFGAASCQSDNAINLWINTYHQ